VFWKKAGPQAEPHWMIVGLGNPGGEYRGTRHNVGFEVIDKLSSNCRIKMDRAKHRAHTGLGKIAETVVLLVKPLTYMNLSGQSVGPLARDYNVPHERIFVIADDLDLPVGKVRIKLGGSAGGHNGHKSIIAYLKTQDYPRLKIGIGSARRGETIDHVLGPFDREEREQIDLAVAACVRACEALARSGMDAALKEIDAYNKGQD
jgi:peptidyl-tRNA hydrolase, PTH1 family